MSEIRNPTRIPKAAHTKFYLVIWMGGRSPKITCLKNDRYSSEKQNHKLKDTCKLVTSPATLIHFLLLF